MEGTQKLQSKSSDIIACRENLFSKIRIINFPVEQKFQKLNCVRTTTNNGNFLICHKLNTLIGFFFISLLFVTFGFTVYSILKQENDYELQPIRTHDELSSRDHPNTYENNNLEDFIEISQPTTEMQSSVPYYLKYRMRRDVFNAPIKKDDIGRTNHHVRRQMKKLKKKSCLARHDYCQNIFASMRNDMNEADKAINNLRVSVDLLNNKQSSDYMKCLECQTVEQHSGIDYQQSDSPDVNDVFDIVRHDKSNNVEKIPNETQTDDKKFMVIDELTDLMNNVKIIKNVSDSNPMNGNVQSQNAPIKYNLPFPEPNLDEDVLTGPDSPNEMSTRDNRDTIERLDYGETLNNEKAINEELPNARSTQADGINSRILTGKPYYQSRQMIGTKPSILPTAETVRTGQQLQLTPSILPYPVCFYGAPPVFYPHANQAQLPIIYPSALPYDHHSSSPSGIHSSISNPTQIPSGNFVAGQGQGFVPFESSNYQSPYVQQFGNSPQLPLGPTSPTGYNNQRVGPTGPGQSFGDVAYPGPLYCAFMPTFQFPTVPGDYQRSSGPAYDFQNKQTYNPTYEENIWRTNIDDKEPSDIFSIYQGNTLQCKSNYHQCLDKSLCVSRTQWCDGKVDCADASDEIRCSCRDRISKDRLCDGYFDCPHGEDELGCFSCPQDAFNCEDWTKINRRGNCLTLSQRCDGIMQCRNGKDEKDCSALMDEDVDDDDVFSVGYATGYLYKNYYGRWYPACTPTRKWAIESCAGETGATTVDQQSPQIILVPMTQNHGPYISKLSSGQIAIVPDCNNQAVFVTCPQIPCGTRVSSDSDQYRSYSRFEDTLVASPHLNSADDQFNKNRTDESKENEEMEKMLFQQEQLSIDSRIVGGRASQPKSWPSIVAIYKDGFYKCGGVILDENWILTAAHCLEKHYTHYYRIAAGLLRRFSFSPMEQSRRADYVIIHPDYYSPLKINDVGLIKLNEPLRFNRWIRPICLPDNSFIPKLNPGEICTTIGWGSVDEHGPEPDHLREVEVPIVPSCKLPSDKIEAVICAGKTQGGKDACQGDSGGPMMCKVPGNGEQWYAAGIVSHGVGCGRPDEPGAYTNVSYFSPWINEIIHDKRALVGPKPLENCPGFSCDGGLGKCLPNHRRCDKNVDCMDAEDEINCPQNKTINQPSFRTNNENISEISTNGNKQNESYPVYEGVEVWTKKSTIELGNIPISVTAFPSIDSTSETTAESKNVTELTDVITTIEPSSMTDDLETMESHFLEQPSRFTCTGLVQSITMDARCNKVIDCEDGTDEVNCTCEDILRNVYPAAICNGRVDCYDLTDEENCIFCDEDEFICIRSGACIPLSKKCDNHIDCPLGEDELDCFALFNHPLFDADNRPATGIPGAGTIIKDVNGIWKTYCSDDSDGDDNKRIVNQVCQYLGFKGMSWLDIAQKPNLTLLNENFEEVDNEFVVWGSNSEFVLLEENETNECYPIITECRKALIAPADSYLYGNASDQNSTYMWPWQGAILIEGKYHCPAILLNDQWFLTSLRCTENIDLNINATTLIVGMSPAYKHVPGPNELTRNVTIIKPLKEFNVSLLRVDPYPLSRYVQPIFAEERFSAPSVHDECFAVGTDPKFNSTTTPIQSAPDSCPSCERCFEREIQGDECKNGTHGDYSGIITCRGPGGWYPAAVFHNKDIICGFQTTQSLMSIDHMFPHLIDAMDDWYLLQPDLPHCDGVRCERGKCIPWKKVCDGIQDCEKGEDELTMSYCEEKQNMCSHSNTIECECSKSQLKCHNGECVPKEMYCDGKKDCSDGSDEPMECTCGEYLKLTAPERVCDNIRHCYDKTDENQCDCTDNSYRCINSNESDECIPYDYICDGDRDCANGEDEAVCRMIKSNPNSKEFAGEVLHRNYGIWHTECFPAPIQNDSQAREICQSFGHLNGKVVTFEDAAPYGPATDLELDNFFMIRLSDKWAITTREAKPLVKLVRAADECHRAFVKCS